MQLFKQAFPHHPASLLKFELASAFRFAVGGDVAVLDRIKFASLSSIRTPREPFRPAQPTTRGRSKARMEPFLSGERFHTRHESKRSRSHVEALVIRGCLRILIA
jgi:hypothetical protein